MTELDEGTGEKGSATFSTFSKGGGLHSTAREGKNMQDPPGRCGSTDHFLYIPQVEPGP